MDIEVQKIVVISSYTLVLALIVAFVLLSVLTHKRVILKYTNNGFKRFFSSSILYYSLKRLGSALITMILAIIVTFLLLRVNSNPKNLCVGLFDKFPQAQQEIMCNELIDRLGLGGSYFSQLLEFAYNVFPFPKYICSYRTGVCDTETAKWGLINFGNSIIGANGKAGLGPMVSELIADAIPVSFVIGIIGLVFTELLGYPFGVFLAKYQNKWFDKLGNLAIILVFSIPTIVFYYLIKKLFDLMGFPILYSESDPFSLVAPGLIMALGSFWSTGLWVRRYMVDQFGSDYVKFARSKGIPENLIMFKHVLRNAIIPLVRSIPSSILYCLTGSFFIEKIYSMRGFGYQLVDTLQKGDFPFVQAGVMISSFISVIAYVSGDILTAICDPRIALFGDNN